MIAMKRAILNDVLSCVPHRPLYHYTTQSGLIGIIKSRTLWATHHQYLNDQREFLHAMDIAREVVDDLSKNIDATGVELLKEPLIRCVRALELPSESINVCVVSFSEDGDSLSQWRAYGGPSGFAIGFDPAKLKVAAGWYLAPCIYDPVKQRATIQAVIEEVLEENSAPGDGTESETTFRELGGNLLSYLYRYAPIMKHESFREEREWRFISRPVPCHREGFDFREGRSTIIPYFKLPLCEQNEEFPVSEIVVGPTREPDRSARSVRTLLLSKNVSRPSRYVPVRNSNVPYRDW
jgi:Protein of unknown function (DUF2971)